MGARSPRARRSLAAAFGLAALLLPACAPAPAVKRLPSPAPAVVPPAPPRPQPPPAPPAAAPVTPAAPGGVLGRSDEYVIVAAARGDTLRSLAARYLGDPGRAWVIADFNGFDRVSPGQEVVIPLRSQDPTGVRTDGYQTVPILCYHRFGDEQAKMVVSEASFAAQMDYLAEHGYRVIPLTSLVDFLQGKRALPERAVVLTADDGYKSTYQIAFPILKKHGFPATIFVYTDFVNARAGLTWPEMKEMVDSGLISIQSHSKAHSNLALPTADEDDAAYRERIDREVSVPTELIHKRLGVPLLTFAYPYGDANEQVIERVQEAGYRLAATVQAGGNPAFAYPFMLRRSMVYGDDDLTTFRRKLDVFHPVDLK